MVLAFVQLGAGDEAAQPLQIAGDAATVEAAHLDLHNLALLLQLPHLLPAVAQGEGTGADGHHAIGVLLPGDEHLDRQPLGEALLEVRDHPQAALALGHEAGGLAADVHVDTIAFHADHDPLDHLTGGADRSVLIEGGEEGLLVEIEIIHGARLPGGGSRCGFGGGRCGATGGRTGRAAAAVGRRAEQVGHGEAFEAIHVEEVLVRRGRRRRSHRRGGRAWGGRSGGGFSHHLLLLLDHQHLGGLAQRRWGRPGRPRRRHGALGGVPGLTRRGVAVSCHGDPQRSTGLHTVRITR